VNQHLNYTQPAKPVTAAVVDEVAKWFRWNHGKKFL